MECDNTKKVVPPKPIEDMTPQELKDFRDSLDCDSMGVNSEVEGVENA